MRNMMGCQNNSASSVICRYCCSYLLRLKASIKSDH